MARFSICVVTLTVLSVLAAAQLATAQSPDDWREAGNSGDQLTLDQSYHGTIPGGGNTLPRVEEIRNLPGNWVTWPGFIMRPDGGSRIFLQTTHQLEYTQTTKKNRTYLQFTDASIHLSNNQNPLVTIHFNTPVRRAYLKRKHKKKVDLVIEMKVAATPSITQYVDQDGYNYLIVDFPPGEYPVGGTWGDRPSFQGFGAPADSQQVEDSEIPASDQPQQ